MAELDHIFLFVSDERHARAMMAAASLRVNYSRIHHGQGTRNLCACLDDIFLELIWLDGSPIAAESERITLAARGRGQGCPIGVSWRGACDLDSNPYAAPFLPAGLTIPVARASLDPKMPFVFQSPGGTSPINRKDDLVGDRQAPHLTVMKHCRLAAFERISVCQGNYGLGITLLGADGRIGRKIRWVSV
jgi:Glyoxalase-like domain